MIFIKRGKTAKEQAVLNARSTPTHISATVGAARTGLIYAIRLQARPGVIFWRCGALLFPDSMAPIFVGQ